MAWLLELAGKLTSRDGDWSERKDDHHPHNNRQPCLDGEMVMRLRIKRKHTVSFGLKSNLDFRLRTHCAFGGRLLLEFCASTQMPCFLRKGMTVRLDGIAASATCPAFTITNIWIHITPSRDYICVHVSIIWLRHGAVLIHLSSSF